MLSVVVPVYNEEPLNLRRLILALQDALALCQVDHEIVFVDDGSKSSTNSVLRQLTQEFSHVSLIVLSRNFGEQAAISAGLAYATGDAVVNMDSDLQDPPEMIPQMLAFWQEGYDVVYTRQVGRKESWSKVLPSMAFYRVLTFLSDIYIPPDAGEFRLLSRRAVDALNRMPERVRFLRGLIPFIGFKQKEIPFVRQARDVGESAYSLKKLLELALQGLLSFSTMPLKLLSAAGVFMIVCAGVWFVTALVRGSGFTNEAVLAGCAIFTGFQLCGLGIVAMYLMQILTESRGRPTFIVADMIGFASKSSQATSRTADLHCVSA